MKNYLHNEYYPGELVHVFDELPLWSAPFGLKLLDYVNYKPNITALDIGFGTGFPLIELAMRLGNSSTVYGIDPWADAIERTRRKIAYYGVQNINIIEGVAESIPLDDNSVDLIVSNNGMNNVQDVNKVLSECSRISREGGQFIMTMNLESTMIEFYDHLERALKEMELDSVIVAMRLHIYQKRRPLDEMLTLIRQHGFVLKDVEHDLFNYKFTNGTAMFNHYFIRMAFMNSWIEILPKNKVEEIFHTIETRLNEDAQMMGGIKLSIPFILINAIKA